MNLGESGDMMRPVPTKVPSARAKPDRGDIVVFWIIRDSVCGEYGGAGSRLAVPVFEQADKKGSGANS
jgi:hypothetical protein